jgi:signal transduction histidine kinase
LQNKYEQNRKELIANISHDLKTPITSIKGYVEGIRDGVASTPEKIDRYIETIYVKATDMDYLIDELFLLSKLELSSVPFHFEEIDLRTFFVYLLEEFQFDLEKAGVSIALAADNEANYKVSADREQLKRIVTNIIQNSLKHMDKEVKEILVHLTAKAAEVIVQVQDNGTGIDETVLPLIFDQFYRADPSRKSGAGSSGLGLAIVKRIVEQQGGAAWAESTVGKGTSIFFSLLRSTERRVGP